MTIELTGKPIVISGGSSGIGLETALQCAKAGMPVVIGARRVDQLREVVEKIEQAGGRAACAPCDVADAQSCRALVELALEKFGSVYAVFANAGYGVEKAVHEMPDEEIRAMFEVNFFGTLNLIRPALGPMIKARQGHVLMCSSCLAKFSIPYFSVYSATKAAQNHLARAMNLELEPMGIRVSSVHPVGTRTEFFDTAKKLSGSSRLIKHTSESFMQSPERVARAIVRCLQRPRPEVWTSWLVRAGMAISMMTPKLADASVRGMVRQRLANTENGRDG